MLLVLRLVSHRLLKERITATIRRMTAGIAAPITAVYAIKCFRFADTTFNMAAAIPIATGAAAMNLTTADIGHGFVREKITLLEFRKE